MKKGKKKRKKKKREKKGKETYLLEGVPLESFEPEVRRVHAFDAFIAPMGTGVTPAKARRRNCTSRASAP